MDEPESCLPVCTVNLNPVQDSNPPKSELYHSDANISPPKSELYRVLNAFQNSHDYGVYVCQKFRDPRRHYIDSYYGEVADEAFGVVELSALVGKPGEPLTEQAKQEFTRFASTLRELAERIEHIVH